MEFTIPPLRKVRQDHSRRFIFRLLTAKWSLGWYIFGSAAAPGQKIQSLLGFYLGRNQTNFDGFTISYTWFGEETAFHWPVCPEVD
jgi:hypothetical protein